MNLIENWDMIMQGLGFGPLNQAEGLTKQHLLKLAGNDAQKFKQAKQERNSKLSTRGFTTLFSQPQNNQQYQSVVNFVARLKLQNQQISDDDIHFLHDLQVDNKLPMFIQKKLKEPGYNARQLKRDHAQYKRQKQIKQTGGLNPKEKQQYDRVKVVHKFADSQWVIPLTQQGKERAACQITGKVGGHCGNMPGESLGGTLYVLRPLQGVKVFATVVVNPQGNIRQRKGQNNTKPNVQNFGQQMLWFVNQPFVKGFDERGRYAPQRNFHISDFLRVMSKQQFDKMVRRKPKLVTKYDQTIMKYMNQKMTGDQIYQLLMSDQISFRERLALEHMNGIK